MTLGLYLTPASVTLIKKPKHSKYWQEWGGQQGGGLPLPIDGGNESPATMEISMGVPQRRYHTIQLSLSGYTPKRIKVSQCVCLCVHKNQVLESAQVPISHCMGKENVTYMHCMCVCY